MSTAIDNIINQDSEFSESKFKSKVENEFVQIMLSIMTGKIERIRHIVSSSVYQDITAKVEEDKKNNRIQMYDELNVSDVKISNIQELDDCFQIDVIVHSKALDYYINRATRKFLSGNNKYRTERDNILVFKKSKDSKELGNARRCPSCGANIDNNKNGKCDYCGSIFKLEKYDWTITKFEIK